MNAGSNTSERVGFMWQRDGQNAVKFHWGRLVGLLLLFVALMAAGVIAEHEDYDGASNVFYGAAGTTFVAALGATVIEKVFR